MKKLYLLRHAKSSWDDSSIPDYERDLNDRGRREAKKMGEYFLEKNIIPDMIICSPSKRTRETYKLVVSELGKIIQTIFEDNIYEASISDIFDAISVVPKEVDSLLIIGHNPGMEDALEKITNIPGIIDKFGTCSLAELEVDIQKWGDLYKTSAKLTNFVSPKTL
ncbi:MAG TPA: histidine phosphatase family protein [Spirochaetota bacterium]|nr:histidine phosphatase family protein [Spirochaetota bacterium]HOS33447.1 histidine phosphatase family protein [Spirochaetota bacterium]HOS56390.1 histidine phosphatase family protein [Spirochaetota bacterium]HPK62216.1 histidine phosphatase family protein [Spirochaetota bacterium]HQF78895.1 histidine phosphatase family protein [Spirochaetota bacterium]